MGRFFQNDIASDSDERPPEAERIMKGVLMTTRDKNQCWPNTRRLESREAMPAARIADVAWIAGHWRGETFGGMGEEMWSPPFGGSMMGMYKMVKDGAVVFYEFLTIVEESCSLVLRLKHFDAHLSGWEEKDASIEFPLVKCTSTEIFFDGHTFRREGDDSLAVFVLLKQKDGQSYEESFHYRRVGEWRQVRPSSRRRCNPWSSPQSSAQRST